MAQVDPGPWTLDRGPRALCPVPCTLCIPLCAVYPRTLHSSPFTLHSSPFTLHPSPFTHTPPPSLLTHRSHVHPLPPPPLSQATDPHLLATAIKLFYRRLPAPLLPADSHATFVACGAEGAGGWAGGGAGEAAINQLSTLRAMLRAMPQPSLVNLHALIEVLAAVASHEDTNRMSAGNLALIFAPTICRPGPAGMHMHMHMHMRMLMHMKLAFAPCLTLALALALALLLALTLELALAKPWP